MTLSSLIGLVSVGGLLTICGGGIASAQALDPAWLAGNWRSALEDPRARTRFQGEIHLKRDGAFEGGVQSDLVGFVAYQDGQWTIAGDTVTFAYGVNSRVGSTTVTWALKRNGDILEGSGLRYADNAPLAVKLTRAR